MTEFIVQGAMIAFTYCIGVYLGSKSGKVRVSTLAVSFLLMVVTYVSVRLLLV